MELTELLVVVMFLLASRLTVSLTSPAPLCDPRLLNKLLRDSATLHSRLSQCSDLGPLPIPVLLPTVDFSLREWRAKTEQTKGQEVLGAVTLFLEGVIAARGQLSPSCLSTLLGQLSAQTRILLGALQGLLGTLSLPKGQTSAHRDPTTIFLSFQQLIQGKVRFLLHAARPILCTREDQAATSSSIPSVGTTSGLKEKSPGSSARTTAIPKKAFEPLNRIPSAMVRNPGLLNYTSSPLNESRVTLNITRGSSIRTHGVSPIPNKPPGTLEATPQIPLPLHGLKTPPNISPTGHYVFTSPSSTLKTPTPKSYIPSTSPSTPKRGCSTSTICRLHSQDDNSRTFRPLASPPT